MKVADIRSRFLDFFAERGHTIVPSSSLVPGNDPTLLFVNSGMVQFKDVFVGLDKRPYNRATTAQRCVRAGGKHNDLDNVGYTARHHTFFEMLGNFSFGDYFKRDAIRYAWDLLTRVYGLAPDRLWTTVYIDDDEAYDIWTKDIGVPPDRCIRIGDNKGGQYASDNFWQMADTGPCGPCSEIFYDHGPDVWGGPPGSPDAEGDRYIEIWNLVFMQFNRDDKGVLHPLPKPSVDTGMGLERLAAVLQHVHSNYEIDLFQDLIRAAARETGAKDLSTPSLRVIADHIRSCAFLIVDGVIPGSEGRGYVLRRIIRRAIRHGYQLGQKEPFFHRLVADLDRVMGDAYPELRRDAGRVAQVLKQEEERFGETIENGMKMLEQALAGGGKVLDGATAFTLYDTFGFPFDLTADVCRERGVTVDEAGFDAAMDAQRERARAASQFKAGREARIHRHAYGIPRLRDAVDGRARHGAVQGRHRRCRRSWPATAASSCSRRRRSTPSRAARSAIAASSRRAGCASRCSPSRTRRRSSRKCSGTSARWSMASSTSATPSRPTSTTRRARGRCAITPRRTSCTRRCATCSGRTSSRRARWSTRTRRGSTSRTTPRSPTTRSGASKANVNAEILRNAPTEARTMAIGDAQKSGAMMLFGEKYGDEVRVLDIGGSRELCGGTHVARTGDIGFFKIVAEGGVAAGIRRVEAVTGDGALAWVQAREAMMAAAASALKVPAEEIEPRVAQLLESTKAAEKEIAKLRGQLALGRLDEVIGAGMRTSRA
jgi:alanyl-tRNA synthetase